MTLKFVRIFWFRTVKWCANIWRCDHDEKKIRAHTLIYTKLYIYVYYKLLRYTYVQYLLQHSEINKINKKYRCSIIGRIENAF